MATQEPQQMSFGDVILYVVVIVLVAAFALSFYWGYGEITQNQLILLGLVVVLLVFKYFSKIEIPGLLKVSKDIEEVKNETKELRNSIHMLAVAQISSNNTININPLAGSINANAEEAKEINEEIPQVTENIPDDEITPIAQEIRTHIGQGKYVAAFAMLRNAIEVELRSFLLSHGEKGDKLYGLSRMSRVAEKYGLPSDLSKAIYVVGNSANDILHSAPYERTIPIEEAKQITDLGIKVLYELKRLKGETQREVQP
jgi:hypothetical protein